MNEKGADALDGSEAHQGHVKLRNIKEGSSEVAMKKQNIHICGFRNGEISKFKYTMRMGMRELSI